MPTRGPQPPSPPEQGEQPNPKEQSEQSDQAQRRDVLAPEPKREEAPREIKAARIAATAALAGALLGALGAGVPAIYTTRTQIAAEDSRSRAEFLRTQQQAAYVELITEHEALVQAQDKYALNLASIQKSDAEGWKRVTEVKPRFINAINNVRLIGTSSTSQAAERLASLENDDAEVITGIDSVLFASSDSAGNIVISPDGQLKISRLYARHKQIIADRQQQAKVFLESARQDLNAGS